MKNKYSFKVIVLSGLLVGCVSALSVIFFLFWHPNFLSQKPPRQLYIPQHITFDSLQRKLQQEGYVTYVTPFNLLARLMRYDRKIISGAYRLSSNMTNWEVIRLLRSGIQQPVKVVLHRAKNKQELAEQLTRQLELNIHELLRLINNRDFVKKHGFNTENVLAMFIPNTYEVYWNVSAAALFERMYKEYQIFWNSDRLKQAKKIQLTPTEISILASIVQSETNKVEEAPLIAGVYINRLRKKIALGSCPTLLHILEGQGIKRVLKKHRNLASPYNTYKNRGLPPGPICVPSIAAIDAVLNFTRHRYFYFSAKEDFSGYHYFTNSFKEHLRNAGRYQNALNRAKIYK